MAAKGKRVSRTQQRAARTKQAASVTLPDHADVCVVGGGAAGLVAAIAAAEKGGSVVVLERDMECGRTILATGNGRCNFANAQLDPSLYNDPSFVSRATGSRWLDDVLGFFCACGLAWDEEAEGRLYPLSRQASSVRNVLLARAMRADVTMAPLREVTDVVRAPNGFVISYRELFGEERSRSFRAANVVVATGGGVSSACTGLGLQTKEFVPLLCPLACTGPALDVLDGRRTHANVTLVRDGATVMTQAGEVLFRTYGLSGVVIFNLSRHAQAGDELALDLIPGVPLEKGRRLGAHTLDGLLDPVVAEALVATVGSAGQRIDTEDTRMRAVARAKRLCYTVVDTTEKGRAQVSRGGLATNQFDPATLQARNIPGFFACGEALDIDGPCGGYNLAWAWKSGLVCGTAIAGRRS